MMASVTFPLARFVFSSRSAAAAVAAAAALHYSLLALGRPKKR